MYISDELLTLVVVVSVTKTVLVTYVLMVMALANDKKVHSVVV